MTHLPVARQRSWQCPHAHAPLYTCTMNRRHTYGNRIIEEAEIARKKAIHRRKRDVRVEVAARRHDAPPPSSALTHPPPPLHPQAPKNKGIDNGAPKVHGHLVTRAKKRMQERGTFLASRPRRFSWRPAGNRAKPSPARPFYPARQTIVCTLSLPLHLQSAS